MNKIWILNGDNVELELNVQKDRFVFLKTEDGRVYHVDLADGNMYRAKEDLSNLGEAHRELVK